MAKHVIAILIALALICASALAQVELFFVNVGKGDAILLKSDDYCALIDTGKKKAQDNILRAMEEMDIDHLDAIFITHCDNDHTGGLKWLRKSEFEIGAIYASAYHPETDEADHPARKAAEKLNVPFAYLKAGDVIPAGSATLYVLAPISEIPDKEDNNSLVMMLDSAGQRALLCGDMELIQEETLINSGADLACDVIKIPNHGDDDACGEALIAAAGASIAVISTSSEEKPGTPSPRVLKLLEAYGVETFVTQDFDLGYRLTLN